MKFNNYRYIYPPRPKNCIDSEDLGFWDNGSLIGQAKLNGSNCTIYTNGDELYVMGRHKQRLSNFNLDTTEIKNLYKGNGEWIAINGEYLNKNKMDESKTPFNHKFVIFDILVYNSDYLIGKTFKDRIEILDNLYGKIESEKEYLYKVSENIYRVKSYDTGFKKIFDDLTPIDMVEGIVLKKSNAKLEIGSVENNNSRSQIKSRKKTLNYKY
jgi:hypothetical protein